MKSINKDVKENVRSQTALIRKLQSSIRDFEKRNQFFEMLISSLPGLFYVFDDQFKVHRWNKNVERVTGYTPEEIRVTNLLVLFTGEDLKRIQESIQQVFETGEGTTEAVLVTKDGRRIPYFFTGVSANIDGVFYLLGMGLDISERKQQEKALQEGEALYRMFADRMTEGVMLLQNFKILFVNNAFASMFGYDDSRKLLGTDVLSLVASGFDLYFKEMFEALEKGMCKERYFQGRWVTSADKEIWVEGRGNLIQWKDRGTILLTARDITETKQKEIYLQEEAEGLRRENVTLRSSIKDRYRFGDIIGKTPAMQKVYELILDAAATSANVIIYGESGTGKELVARAIHDTSSRSAKAFVTVNSAAIPENLLESEFFGYKKGAFTGASTDKAGYLDQADGGTLFLDEVGELNPGLQAKLLRAIEGGGYSPVGSTVLKKSDFRIIAATNRNLVERTKNGSMREDFFYRIHIIPIHLPPLRERKDDIPLLAEHFLKLYAGGKKIPAIPGREMELLFARDWPGNVRELQNVIQRYIAVGRFDFLEQPVRSAAGADAASAAMPGSRFGGDLKGNVNDLERVAIQAALERYRWNKTRAAKDLGISRKTLDRKIKRLGLL